jgi:hypothetical protein
MIPVPAAAARNTKNVVCQSNTLNGLQLVLNRARNKHFSGFGSKNK